MSEKGQSSAQFDRYSSTLYTMAQGDPRTSGLTPQQIKDFWTQLPTEEKNGILLLAQFQQFFWDIRNRSLGEQEVVMSRDINRKNDPNFALYTRLSHDACNEMVAEGKLLGQWYISQGGKTILERDLDESGVDRIIQRPDEEFILLQLGTTPGNVRDKVRHFGRRYGTKFDLSPFIASVPVRDFNKQVMSKDSLKSEIESQMYMARSFGPNLMASAFPQR